MFGTSDPGLPGVQQGAVLEEVEMTPGPIAGVMDLAAALALRTGEGGPWGKIQPEVELLPLGGELDLVHGPGRRQAKSHSKKSSRRGIHLQPTSGRETGRSPIDRGRRIA